MIIEVDDYVLDVEWEHQNFELETLESPAVKESITVDGAYVD
jgi:hypothetical protein